METFKKKAIDITKGGNEFAQSKKWLSIWWPPDELSMIECCSGGKLDALFAEAEDILSKITWPNSSKHAKGALFDAFTLNKKVLKLPFHNDILNVELSYNIWSYYRNVIYSENVPLKKGDFVVKIDRRSEKWNSWEDWCREVIWYGNKRGAYLYPARELQ
jgi:hypothetical protein